MVYVWCLVDNIVVDYSSCFSRCGRRGDVESGEMVRGRGGSGGGGGEWAEGYIIQFNFLGLLRSETWSHSCNLKPN